MTHQEMEQFVKLQHDLAAERARGERLREALSQARDWMCSNTTKPIHDLLKPIDAALAEPATERKEQLAWESKVSAEALEAEFEAPVPPAPEAATPADAPTPETDATITTIATLSNGGYAVPINFARKLERDRDTLRTQLAAVTRERDEASTELAKTNEQWLEVDGMHVKAREALAREKDTARARVAELEAQLAQRSEDTELLNEARSALNALCGHVADRTWITPDCLATGREVVSKIAAALRAAKEGVK